MTRRRLAWGAAAAALYIGAALATAASGLLPVRPLYDGAAPPPPYRYVDPPADLADQNEPPLSETAHVEFGPDGSLYRTIGPDDTQCLVVFREKGIAPREGETRVRVTIRPLDPDGFPAVPEGLVAQGNAYRVTAVYDRSGEPAELTDPVDVILRYPVHGSAVLRARRGGWTNLVTTGAPASFQVFAESDDLGVFLAAGPPVQDGGRPWLPFAVGGAAVVAAGLGWFSARRGRRTSDTRRRAPRAARRRAERMRRERRR